MPRASNTDSDKAALTALQALPGIGPSMARDLLRLGYRAPDALRGADPEEMYRGLEALEGRHVDRCVLYVFRCAVHVAETGGPDPALRLWWNWKDRSRA
ncbi:helix-hairpin-helix domain-containing protein [Desulfovibrio aminophilus]|nr:helix-hairpin-helix domain-containing protein [Desulfovibrio aminophilus]MCM0756600.1 helix-hairpin-helix domain-containing protein [Desulfovibrio aminophilus]